MIRNNKRILSIIMAFAMIFTVMLGNFNTPKVFAEGNDDSQPLQSKYEDLIKESFNINEDNKKEVYDPNKQVRLIVELEEKAVKDYITKDTYSKESLQMAAQDKELVNKVLDTQSNYKNSVKEINNNIKFRKSYSLLLNGFSMEAKYGDIEKIKEIPGVRNVTVAKVYYPVPNMNYANDLGNVTKVWQDYGYNGEGLVVSIIDTGIDYTHKDMVVSDSTLVKLTQEKIEGMNSNLPNAKGKYFTRKIPYGYNFADDNYNIIASGDSHGMHVAGIVGANCQSEEEIEANRGIKGVAPEVQLLAMKVFSNNPKSRGALTDDIVAAIEDSVAHGADVINMSLGSIAGFQNANDPEQKAIREAVEHGVMVVVSAGNSTTSTAPFMYKDMKDTGLAGAPGLAHEALQVASFENSQIVRLGFGYKTDSEQGLIPYDIHMAKYDPVTVLESVYGEVGGEYEIVDCGLGRLPSWNTDVDDFNGIDLTGKIALIERGEIYFTDKILNAQNHGAAGVIIYNHEKGGEDFISMQEHWAITIPAVFIRHSDGIKLSELINENVNVSFNGNLCEFDNSSDGDMSDFTSWGPAPNLDFKPQITGIGGEVYSTINNNEYASYSGTSMSSPFVAGIMSLIYQHIDELGMKFNTPQERVEFAKALVINTASVKLDKEHPDIPYSPRRQGAGLINAKAAIENEVTVTVDGEAVAALKEMGKATEFTMTLHNYGTEDVTYNVVDLSGVLTEVEIEEDIVEMMPYDVKMEGASISFDKEQVTVKAGEEAQVKATITMDEIAHIQSFAEGYIRFVDVADNVPTIGMPYMGFYGEWDKLMNIDNPCYEETSVFGLTTLRTQYVDWAWETDLSLGNGDPLYDETVNPQTYGINPDNGMINNVVPALTFLRNVKEMTIDITDENGKVIRTITKENEMSKIVTEMYYYAEVPFYTIDLDNWKWDGTVYDSQTGKHVVVPEGQYYVNIRTKTDIENAEEQVVTMPIKVDKTAPTIEISGTVDISKAGSYEIKFNAEDGVGAGVRSFAFYIDGKVYYDEYWNSQFKPKDLEYDKETDMYSMKLKLPEPTDDFHMYNIVVTSLDNAGNVGESNITVFYSEYESWDIEVNTDKEVYDIGEEITINYTVPDNLLEKTDHFELRFWDDDYNRIILDMGKELSYTLDKDTFIKGGSKFTTILAIDADGEELAFNYFDIRINSEFVKINLYNLFNRAIYFNGNVEINGSLTSNHYETFKINGEEVTLGAETFFGYNPLVFNHNIELEPGKWNKVTVELIGKNGENMSYGYSVAYDDKAPTLELEDQDSQENNIEIFVNGDSSAYTVKGSVKDDMFGYKLLINGEVIENLTGMEVLGDESLREFEYEVALNEKTTTIKVEAIDLVGNTTTKTINIIKTYENSSTPIKIENLAGNKTFKNGEQARLDIRATNLTKTERAATLIIALYDENNNMVNVVSTSQRLDANESVIMTGMINIPKTGNYTLKCFVWDTWDNMKPLSEVNEYKIQR